MIWCLDSVVGLNMRYNKNTATCFWSKTFPQTRSLEFRVFNTGKHTIWLGTKVAKTHTIATDDWFNIFIETDITTLSQVLNAKPKTLGDSLNTTSVAKCSFPQHLSRGFKAWELYARIPTAEHTTDIWAWFLMVSAVYFPFLAWHKPLFLIHFGATFFITCVSPF